MNKQWVLALLASLSTSLLAQPSVLADYSNPELRKAMPGSVSSSAISPEKVKRDRLIAYALARNEWFDKIAEADPRIVAAVCAHSGPAKILAKHKHLDKIAEADHYLCRRLTQWEGSTQKLIRNPYFDKVVALDPQGMYFAMNRKPEYARVMSRDIMVNQLTDADRNFDREMQKHIR